MTFRKVQNAARKCGLFVYRYNPGGNMTYKVLSSDVDYFAASSKQTLLRAKKLATVRKFLARVGCDATGTKRSKR
jgi:hypothetical protein